MANPTFGEKKENVTYQYRYGVYAVIPDPEKKQIVLVQAPNGAWFLPGGEIKAGEDHQEALKRELIEELGFTAEIGSYFGQADEYFYSRHRDTYYYNPAYLYEAILRFLAANFSFTISGFALNNLISNIYISPLFIIL